MPLTRAELRVENVTRSNNHRGRIFVINPYKCFRNFINFFKKTDNFCDYQQLTNLKFVGETTESSRFSEDGRESFAYVGVRVRREKVAASDFAQLCCDEERKDTLQTNNITLCSRCRCFEKIDDFLLYFFRPERKPLSRKPLDEGHD